MQPEHVLAHEVWLPPRPWQEQIVQVRREVDAACERHAAAASSLKALFPAFLDRVFKGEL